MKEYNNYYKFINIAFDESSVPNGLINKKNN